MKGAQSWLVRWACRAGTRDFCSALAASSKPSTRYFFPHCELFQFLCPQAQQDVQAAVLGRLY
jgi:hypothetical protein